MLMAQINITDQPANVARKRAGVKRMIRHHLKVDMTPMVDLGFLLISFFVITTELSKPTAMDLAMPKEGVPSELAESAALTVFTKDDNIYCYQGKWEEAVSKRSISPVQLSGENSLRAVISKMQISLDNNKALEKGREELMLLIKPGPGTSYKTVVDLLDEATISMVKKFAVIQQTPEEENWLKMAH